MGCGCGGNKRVRSTRPSQALQAGASARAQVQSNQRQALVQQARERIQQSNGIQQQQQVSGLSVDQNEKKRRIQVTLRSRNNRIQEN